MPAQKQTRRRTNNALQGPNKATTPTVTPAHPFDASQQTQPCWAWLCLLALSIWLWPSLGLANLSFGNTEKKVWDATPDWQGGGKSVNISWKVDGQIEIDDKRGKQLFSTPYIYIPNSESNTLVQLDTKTGRKRWSISLGRVAPDGSPSRTTVDIKGNVWVGLRGSTKIAQVSSEGKILKIISIGDVPRAITVDFNGDIWAGAYLRDIVVRINSETGKIEHKVDVPCPYGATTDTFGNIWVVSRCDDLQQLVKISPRGQILGQFVAKQAYGIAADADGQIWTSNVAEGCVHRFANNGRHLGCASLGEGCDNGRGVAIDGQQNVWVACSNQPIVAKLSSQGKLLTQVKIPSPNEQLVGLAVDANGFIWAVSRANSSATKIDTRTNRLIGTYTTHGLDPYTYSDMTGFQLQAVAKRATGTWRGVFEAPCRSYWRTIRWDSKTPPGTSLEVRARSARTREALEKAVWSKPLLNGSRPGVPDNPWIEIQARLISYSPKLTPVISKIVLEYMSSGKELCNGLDDDCDGKIDNVLGTTTPITDSCTLSCRPGTRRCGQGRWTACTSDAPPIEGCDPNAHDPGDGGVVIPDLPFHNGPLPEPKVETGCSCQSTSSPPWLGLLFLICALSWPRAKRPTQEEPP